MDSVIVKLGKNKSNLLFRNTYMIRAITVMELYSHFEESNTLIIENVKENELEHIKEAIVAFKDRSEDNRVLFYVVDNDLTTLNLAKELNCSISNNLFDIQQEVSYIFKRDVSTYLSKRCETERLTPTERLLIKASKLLDSTDEETRNIIQGLIEEVGNKESTDESRDVAEQFKQEKESLVNRLAEKEKLHTVLQNTLENLQNNLNDKVNRLMELENILKSKEEETEQLKSRAEQIQSDFEIFKGSTEVESNNSKERTEELNKEIETLRKEHEKLLKDMNQAEYEHNIELDYMKDEFNNRRKEIVGNSRNVIETYKIVIGNLHDRIMTHKTESDRLKSELEQSSSKIAYNENEIEALNIRVQELTEKATNTDSLIDEAVKEERNKVHELVISKASLDGEIRTLKAELEATKLSYNELLNSGASIAGMKALQDNNQMLNDLVKTLREQITTQKLELDKQIKEKGFISNIKDDLEQKVQSLNRSLRTMTDGMMNGGNAELPPCNYSGRGLIIPVIGSGSYGITTTAMSLANKLALTSKVLFIDFDLVMPKADSWFNKNPIIQEAPGFDKSNYSKYTGLGLFIEKQSDYFTHNANTLIQRVKDTKDGYLDYLSGIYTKPDTIKLVSANYTSFFNYCGNSYDYIIVDCGKFGCSDLNNQLIKLITNVAYRTVVVTTQDKFEIRTFRIKLTEAKIDVANICWLINMCKNTSLDKAVKGFISPAEIGMIPECFDIFGEKKLFSSQRITRDKFDIFVNTIFDTKGLK